MSATTLMLPAPHSSVVYRALPDGGVLFSTVDEVYFGLNETGALMWEHLAPQCATVDELCTVVRTRYPDADPALVHADAAQLVASLVEHGLVVPSERSR